MGLPRKTKKKRNETFSLYIYKVLKQVHPEKGISKKAMNIMNSMVYDIFDQILYKPLNLLDTLEREPYLLRRFKLVLNYCCQANLPSTLLPRDQEPLVNTLPVN